MAQREQDILRVDARDKVTGRTKYAADLVFDGILYTKSVHADLPHGKLLAVHTAAALAAEGVAGVYTARDIPGRNVGDNEKPIMVYDTIRSRGDCIAVVAAVSQEAADRAARLVTYDAQPMPAVFDPEEALLPDAPKLYDGGNLILEDRVRKGRAAKGFDEADIIVEREFRTQRVIPGAIEPESVVVSPQDGELRVYCPCKAPFNIRRIVAAACGLPMSAVRVTQPGMGGSFGGKDDDAGAMAARAAIAALHTGRPCRMTWRSSETLLEGVKRHPFHIYYKAGAKRDGTLTAIEVRGFVDGGAYLSKSKTTTWRSGIEATGPYRVEHVDVCMKAAYTNNCYAGSVRGFGSPQIDFATESVMDELAQQLGMTPWAFREKNLLRDGDISGSGQPMRDVSAGVCLERLRREFGEDLRPFVRNGKLVGRGIACLYRGESYGAGTPVQDTSGVTIVLNADGSLNVSTGLSEVGQGGHTLLTAIIGRELGLPPERIHIAPADTDYCVDSGSTAASRGTITAGNAAWLAAQEAKQQINTALWEYRGFDGPIVYEDGLVRCGDEQMTFTEAVGVLRNTGRDMRAHGWWAAPKTFWDREKCRGSNYMSYAYGACGAEVEIDPITGKTDVTDFVAVHDMGRIINHAATVGQVGGGVSMGVGYALTENADTPGGVTRAADLDSYLLPTALDMCPVRTVLLEEGAGVPPLLVHGIGEPATSIVAPAITNAMSAALGARIDTLPADLETVRAILDEKKR